LPLGSRGHWAPATHCRLKPFKKLATTIKERFDAVVRGMLDHRSNAFVESMNGKRPGKSPCPAA
jgi:transposase